MDTPIGGDPAAGADDVPAEVPDYIDPASVSLAPTPLDEDTSEPVTPEELAHLDALLAGDDE